jgi:hypothetical protein
MAATIPNSKPADALAALVARGVARYQATLPDFPPATLADVEPQPNVSGIDEARQIQLCLACSLPDCIGVENPACPIRQAQRALWRNRRRP